MIDWGYKAAATGATALLKPLAQGADQAAAGHGPGRPPIASR